MRARSIQITREREAPFSFWENEKKKIAAKQNAEAPVPDEMLRPQFKATPIPRSCAVNIYRQKTEAEDRARRERVRANAERALDKAKMPKTMQLYADEKKRKEQEGPPKNLQEEYSFKPTVGPEYDRAKVQAAHARLAKQQSKKSTRSVVQAKEPNWWPRPVRAKEQPFIDEGQRPKPIDKHTLLMKRLAEKARAQAKAEAMGDGEPGVKVAPSTTRSTQLAVQKRRAALQARQREERERKKELDDREARLKKKKPADELLGVLGHDKTNGNLALLKITQKQVEALKKVGEKPDIYLTDKQKMLLEDDELRESLKKKLPAAQYKKD